jgi:hypothetical protein
MAPYHRPHTLFTFLSLARYIDILYLLLVLSNIDLTFTLYKLPWNIIFLFCNNCIKKFCIFHNTNIHYNVQKSSLTLILGLSQINPFSIIWRVLKISKSDHLLRPASLSVCPYGTTQLPLIYIFITIRSILLGMKSVLAKCYRYNQNTPFILSNIVFENHAS